MNKILVVALIALCACNFNEDAFTLFKNFIKKYNKKYESMEEFMARFNVFKSNILKLQSEKTSHKTGITKFSDLTQQEFAKKYLTLDFNALATINFQPTHPSRNDAPEAYDWRDQGYVSNVKDQASCGSCWAFSTVANLEGQYYKGKKVMKTFSEQMLVDCDTMDSGCSGGLMERTFTWLKNNGGIMEDKDYPYTGRKGTCAKDETKYVDMKITGYKKLGDCTSTWCKVPDEDIKNYLYETGPLAVALNANYLSAYTGGIVDYDNKKCSLSGMNHAVTMVGYGRDDTEGKEYWIIKNSWGQDWGEEGYFRIFKGNDESGNQKCVCGICQYITSGIVEF